ncbi:MAG: hypothetical protein AMXMBFR33_35990 [Candidatus Xenobia bacterium]|jgi:tRNA pseudouridine13 synthase
MYVTAAFPGTGGQLKGEPEDFQVVELPAYEPVGEGPHQYLEVTKRDLTTPELLRRMARALEVRSDDIGYAGLKDRQAVTTQRISVPLGADLSRLAGLENVLEVKLLGQHHNKLRRGHLRGNRFTVRVRGAKVERASAIAEELRRTGWANRFGAQRFGRGGENLEGGMQLLREGRSRLPHWKRNLLVSSVQSELFNRYLDERFRDGLFARVLLGDVCGRLPAGSLFVATDPMAEQERLERFEISPTGPIFGFKMMRATGPSGQREEDLLAASELTWEAFRPLKAQGSRRRIRLPLEPFTLRAEGTDLVFQFELPPGSYATVLLDEFLKSGQLAEELAPDLSD